MADEHLQDEELAAYIAGAPETEQRVKEHIDRCADCRRLFVALVFGESSDATTEALTKREGFPPTRPSPVRSAFEVGATVLGKYTIERVLGEGGMGRVVLAHDRTLDRRVAIKMMRDDLADDATARARFEREARTIARLGAEHAVRVHDFGMLGPLPFIVMEYVEGTDLRARVKENGPLAPDEAASYVRAACAALAEAHRAGIVHRDVKPQNLLLTPAGAIKLVDFGIAKTPDAAPLTREGVVVGTVPYMAPEQLGGGEIDARADIWALGATLFYLLAGRPPFEAPTRQELVAKILSDPAPHVRDLRPEVSAELDAVVARCLSKSPGDRWPDVDALRDALAVRTPRKPRVLPWLALGIVGIGAIAFAWPKTAAPPVPHAATAHCTCTAEDTTLCKPELAETECECHDNDNGMLWTTADDVGNARTTRRKVPGKSVADTDGMPCTGFASVKHKNETAFHAEPGSGALHPCFATCPTEAAFAGASGEACRGLDEAGQFRTGKLACEKD